VASTSALCLEALRAPAGVTVALQPVSSDAVRARAPKALTTGETLDFRTLVPQPGGLFDYKLFGPGTVIDAPALDLDAPARPPKTQFARIVLPAAVVHPLAFAHAPARLAALAGWSEADVLACRGDAARRRLADLAAALEASPDGRAFVLRELAVLPPDLRPLIRLDDDRWQTSPINEQYRHVMRRSSRLAKAIEGGGPPDVLDAELAGLHGALESLFENLSALAGGPTELFDALGVLAGGGELTGRLYRASAVVFALGFELASPTS